MHPITRANLETALAGEALAALRFRLFAERARADGLNDVSEVFQSICCAQHRGRARALAEILGVVHDTAENLSAALESEVTDHHRLFPLYAAHARRAGDIETAQLFVALGRGEHAHAGALRAAIARLRGTRV
jgi:rubrerythrin